MNECRYDEQNEENGNYSNTLKKALCGGTAARRRSGSYKNNR